MPRKAKQKVSPESEAHSDEADNKKSNADEKKYVCPIPCGRRYSSVGAWHTHFKQKHRDIDQNASQIHDEFYRSINEDKGKTSKQQANNKKSSEKEAPFFTHHIQSNTEEANHKINSDNTYLKICNAWRQQQNAVGLMNISEVLWNRQTDLIDVHVQSFDDIVRIRKKKLQNTLNQLLEQYQIHELMEKTKAIRQFQDYKVIDGKRAVNFAWDILTHFRPTFASKIVCIIHSLTIREEDLQLIQGWERFKSEQWQHFKFIDQILKDYHREWLALNHQRMIFI